VQTQAHNGTAARLRTASAASGLLLVFFLLLHLAGVALAPLAPQRFEAYAAALHGSAWLPAAELVLLAVALVHLGLSLARGGASGPAALAPAAGGR
jgi:succinate dehydrogenase / fumarate reductase cytochrome b subunit